MAKRKNKQKRRSRERTARARARRRGPSPAVWLGIATVAAIVFVVFAVRYGRATQGTYLPPTDVAGHAETVPPSHILTQPMPISMFKHMLEHADGRGLPGVIISYNCDDFECEPDLIPRLEAIVQDYPDIAYLAPFPGMTAKLVVTRRGAQIVLEEFDEERIRDFIERGG